MAKDRPIVQAMGLSPRGMFCPRWIALGRAKYSRQVAEMHYFGGLLNLRLILMGVVGAFAISSLWAESDESILEEAYAFDSGEQGDRDAGAAAQLYQAAATAGDPHAQCRLGYLYETGDGVSQDFQRARELYEQAVAADLPEARLRLAICHLEGWGGPKDRAGFIDEIMRAAEADYVPAQHILANVYFTGFHLPKDRDAAIHWLERAALADDADAQHRLGNAAQRIRSINIEANLELAREWYALSAEQDYLSSMRAMSKTFLRGPAEDREWDLARDWLLLADELGDKEAPYMLASYAVRNPHAFPDLEDPASLFQRAVDRGNIKARDVLNTAKLKNLSLLQASRHVMSTPYEERYVQNVAAKFDATYSEDTHPPQAKRLVTPFYPESLHLTEITGEALIKFVVDVKGIVRVPEVVSATHPLFGTHAVEAVGQWRFLPARRKGRLVNSRMQVPVYFKIAEDALQGVDKMLELARRLARGKGGTIQADSQDLRMAKPVGKMKRPRLANGNVPPHDARAIIVVVLDEKGTPQRGHVLEGKPVGMGEAVLEVAMETQFQPREIDGEPVAGSVVLYLFPRKPKPSAP